MPATSHASLESFYASVPNPPGKEKKYTLVVSVSPSAGKILLGRKLRGFGEGLYNGFGGKPDGPNESLLDCACREMLEESGVECPHEFMMACGVLTFTGLSPVTMVVHLYRVNLDLFPCTTPQKSDEMSPEYFPLAAIPYDEMFDDDKLWLPLILSKPFSADCDLRGTFHFEGDVVSNYYLSWNDTLEKALFHGLHSGNGRLSPKEFNEAHHFSLMVQRRFKKKEIHHVIDVCGGHGAVAHWLMLRIRSAGQATVIDPAECTAGRTKVVDVFSPYLKGRKVKYVHERLEDALAREVGNSPATTLVVACHACQYLTKRILEICENLSVAFVASMPCCQKDETGGLRELAKKANLEVGVVSDIQMAGWLSRHYEVKVSLIDRKITPVNRVITGQLRSSTSFEATRALDEKSEVKLDRAYRKAHKVSSMNTEQASLRQLASTGLIVMIFAACGQLVARKNPIL